jgi:hypothetical protein
VRDLISGQSLQVSGSVQLEVWIHGWLRVADHGERTGREQAAQIPIALFADAANSTQRFPGILRTDDISGG